MLQVIRIWKDENYLFSRKRDRRGCTHLCCTWMKIRYLKNNYGQLPKDRKYQATALR